jgi:hypothetical protein
MSKRHLTLAAVLALVAAACGGAAEPTTTTGGEPTSITAPETTTTTSSPVETVLLSYALSSGDELHYEVALDQHIELSASGDPSIMGDGEVPGEAAVDLSGTAEFTHVVSDGPEPGTYEVHITGEFTDIAVKGIVDGEEVDSSEVPEFAAIEPVDVTLIVDEKGRPVTSGGIEDPLAGIFGGMGAMGGNAPAPGLDIGQFVGPALPDEEVGVGDTWSDEIEVPGLGGDPIVTNVTSTVTGVDQVEGIDVLVIETSSTTSPIEFDLAELFAGMFGGFLPEEATDTEKAELDAMLDQLRFLMTIDDATAETTSRFDVEAGLARQTETRSGATIKMDMNVPDETTGELAGFVMEMSLDQDITYRLLSVTDA